MKKSKKLFLFTVLCILLFCVFTVSASAATYLVSVSGTMRDTSSPDNGTISWVLEYNRYTRSAKLTLRGDGYMPNYPGEPLEGYDTEIEYWYNTLNRTGCYLKELVIEEGVRSISESAFYGEQYLTSVKLPDSIEFIGDYAFKGTAITSVTLPSKIETINGTVFDPEYIKNYYVDENNPYLKAVDGVLYNKDMTVLQAFPVGRYTDNSEYTFNIPKSVKTIAPYAFLNSNAEVFTVPGTVKTISSQAFAGNIYLTKLTLGSGIEYIYDSAFLSCPSLKSVTIPSSVKYVGYMAFGFEQMLDCEAIEAQLDCAGVSHPEITESNAWFYVTYTEYTLSEFTYWGYDEEFNIKATDNTAGASYVLSVSTPKMKSTKPVYGGIKVYWNSLNFADGYYVYRKKGTDGSWKLLGKVKGKNTVSYIDKTASAKTTYYYSVSAYDNLGGVSDFSDKGIKGYYKVSAPKLSSAKNTSKGVSVKWNKVSGANGYYVYRKTSSGSFTKIATVKSGSTLSYTDTKAKSGTTYSYTVKAYAGDSVSAYNTKGVSVKYLSVPRLSSVKNKMKGIVLNWNKVSGAKGYYVYRKMSGDDKWTKIATLKDGSTLTYTDKNAKPGKKYYYTVRAYSGDYSSTIKSSDAIKRLSTPTLKSVSSGKSGVTFKWNKVTGAEGYIVYRKTGSGEWKRLATLKGNSKISYLDKSAKKGTTYTYTVRAYSGDTNSSYNLTGLKIKDKY